MSKGIKMRSGTDRQGNPYTAESLQTLHDDGQPIPDLVCDHPPCATNVRFVPRHQQNRANRVEPVDVPAYIGLTSGSEHVTGCRYDAPGRLKAIVAQSDPDFVKALEDGKRELRLLALHNGLQGTGLSGQPATASPARPGSAAFRRATTSYIPSEKKLTSYLRTAADLVALRAACESDTFLASELILRLGPRRIPWSRFFFERDSYDEAWELAKSSGNAPYPLALAGVVRSHYSPPAGSQKKYGFLNCESLFRRTDRPDKTEVFEVSVMHQDPTWLNAFPIGSDIVMFGLWRFNAPVESLEKKPLDPAHPRIFVTHKLLLQPKFKRQVIEAA
ncbi:hypothetical protein [Cupriavidus basilensis]|uniref:hypothetical protein n=1 Tax=Cupriavidus basilensis TaxID=68895 RepID=UPI00157A914B|nr:hypothetical protein [Cupriavidus basilensis]NUA25972.1 hypothetical protein [Cupriavidus basilensis]